MTNHPEVMPPTKLRQTASERCYARAPEAGGSVHEGRYRYLFISPQEFDHASD